MELLSSRHDDSPTAEHLTSHLASLERNIKYLKFLKRYQELVLAAQGQDPQVLDVIGEKPSRGTSWASLVTRHITRSQALGEAA